MSETEKETEKIRKDFYEIGKRMVEKSLKDIESQLCYPLSSPKREGLKEIIKMWDGDLTCDLIVVGNLISFPMLFEDKEEASQFFLNHGWEEKGRDFGFKMYISLNASQPIRPEATDEEMKDVVYNFIRWHQEAKGKPPKKIGRMLFKIMAGFGIYISEDKFHELFLNGLQQAIEETTKG